MGGAWELAGWQSYGTCPAYKRCPNAHTREQLAKHILHIVNKKAGIPSEGRGCLSCLSLSSFRMNKRELSSLIVCQNERDYPHEGEEVRAEREKDSFRQKPTEWKGNSVSCFKGDLMAEHKGGANYKMMLRRSCGFSSSALTVGAFPFRILKVGLEK